MTAPIVPVTPKVPTEEVELPSKGVYYAPDNPLSKGKVELLYPTARTEDLLTSANLLRKGIVIDRLIESLLVDKTIDYNTLLMGDRNAILVAIRMMSYGASYTINVECPKCEETSEQTINLLDVDDKDVKLLPEGKGTNEFKYTLPASKVELTFKLLTAGDENEVQAFLDNVQKKVKNDTLPEVTTRIKKSVVAIGDKTDDKSIREFINIMPLKDSKAFRDYARSINPDIDLSFDYTCPDCQYSERMAIGITREFFWPD